jgi:hypothetical protein
MKALGIIYKRTFWAVFDSPKIGNYKEQNP